MNKDKENHFIMIKEPIYHEGITTINVYVPDNRDSKPESKVNKIKWRNSGNSVRLYLFGLQNQCRW